MYKSGDVVCDYKILELLAQGGFSQIYKANAPDDTLVILKFPEVSLLVIWQHMSVFAWKSRSGRR